MDRRVLPGLVAGVGGLAAGVGAIVIDSPLLAALAGVSAFAAGGAALPALRRTDESGSTAQPDLIDRATGLPGGAYFALALDARLRSARRRGRPLTLAVVQITLQREERGRAEAKDAASTAGIVGRVAKSADEVALLRPGCFGLIYDDTADSTVSTAVDQLQEAVSAEVAGIERLAAGVAVYPVAALAADDLLHQAESALARVLSDRSGTRLLVAGQP